MLPHSSPGLLKVNCLLNTADMRPFNHLSHRPCSYQSTAPCLDPEHPFCPCGITEIIILSAGGRLFGSESMSTPSQGPLAEDDSDARRHPMLGSICSATVWCLLLPLVLTDLLLATVLKRFSAEVRYSAHIYIARHGHISRLICRIDLSGVRCLWMRETHCCLYLTSWPVSA